MEHMCLHRRSAAMHPFKPALAGGMERSCIAQLAHCSSDSVGVAAPPTEHNGSGWNTRFVFFWLLQIGKGHYGRVYLATARSSGLQVAVKLLDKRRSKPHRLKLEVSVAYVAGKI